MSSPNLVQRHWKDDGATHISSMKLIDRMPSQPVQSTPRYAYIDVLRGLAALMVVYLHSSEIFLAPQLQINATEKSIIDFFSHTIGLGEVGVCIFLMISGFVVPFSLLRYQFKPVKNFVAHRFFRLYPAYWLSVPLAVFFVPSHDGQAVSWGMMLTNLTMLQDFVGVPDMMGQYWTLALELLFYALCVILFVRGSLGSAKAVFIVLVSFILFREAAGHIPIVNKDAFGKITSFRYLDFMFFGLLYRQWLLDGDKMAGRQCLIILVMALLTFGAVTDIRHFFAGNYVDSSGNLALKTPLTHLTAAAIFVLFTRFYKMTNAVGIFLGKISYSIYLFHPVIFYPLYFKWFQDSSLNVHPHVFVATTMILTILFSALTYHFIEKPCVDYGRRKFSGSSV